MQVYVFFRSEGWYPIECKDDEDAKNQAETNPGTVKVEDVAGRDVWKASTKH
jgi:hypothetical protein